jgi:hypothetical protein
LARIFPMPSACLHVCGVQWSGVGSLRVSYSAAPRLCAPPSPFLINENKEEIHSFSPNPKNLLSYTNLHSFS